jgi:predicted transcriptional regulator
MRGFGDLEAAIMQRLWNDDGSMSVREVQEALSPERRLAYTTVMTVLDNLHRKGWLRRQMYGRAYRYEPVASRDEYTARLMSEALRDSGSREAAFMHFVDDITTEDVEALRHALRKQGRKRRGR